MKGHRSICKTLESKMSAIPFTDWQPHVYNGNSFVLGRSRKSPKNRPGSDRRPKRLCIQQFLAHRHPLISCGEVRISNPSLSVPSSQFSTRCTPSITTSGVSNKTTTDNNLPLHLSPSRWEGILSSRESGHLSVPLTTRSAPSL